MKEKLHSKSARITGAVLFVTLVLSVIYALVRLFLAPTHIEEGLPYQKLKSDYLLMLIQCALGLAVMMLPTFISKKWKIVVPNGIVIVYFLFLYCAIYLGEVRNFYYSRREAN